VVPSASSCPVAVLMNAGASPPGSAGLTPRHPLQEAMTRLNGWGPRFYCGIDLHARTAVRAAPCRPALPRYTGA